MYSLNDLSRSLPESIITATLMVSEAVGLGASTAEQAERMTAARMGRLPIATSGRFIPAMLPRGGGERLAQS